MYRKLIVFSVLLYLLIGFLDTVTTYINIYSKVAIEINPLWRTIVDSPFFLVRDILGSIIIYIVYTVAITMVYRYGDHRLMNKLGYAFFIPCLWRLLAVIHNIFLAYGIESPLVYLYL